MFLFWPVMKEKHSIGGSALNGSTKSLNKFYLFLSLFGPEIKEKHSIIGSTLNGSIETSHKFDSFFIVGQLNLQVKGVVQGDIIQQILKDWQLVNQRILSISLSLTIYVQFPKTLKMTRSSVESIASTLG